MQLTLQESELQQIIRNHVAALITLNEGTTLDVSIKALRGTEGFTAVVDIINEGEEAPKTVVPKRATRATKSPVNQAAPKAEEAKQEPEQQTSGEVASEGNEEAGQPSEGADTAVQQEPAAVEPETVEVAPAAAAEDPPFDADAEEAALAKSTAPAVAAKTTPATAPVATGARPAFPAFKGFKKPGG